MEVVMNKKELVESVSKERNLTKKDAEFLIQLHVVLLKEIKF